MNKLAALTASLWVVGTSAYASDASFNEAVNLYLKGYADCREANALRSDDIKQARQRFDNYLKVLDQAAAIDPSILKSTERDMDANLTYCERVNENLKMAEAAPVLESSFEQCELAKTSLETNNVAAAQQALDAYAVQRDQALAITGNIMEVFSLASQVRACSRLEEKLADMRKANDAEATAIANLRQQLNHYSQKCQMALSFTRQNTFTVDTIDQANRLLADAQHYRKQAASNSLGTKALQQESLPPEMADLKQLEAAAGRCEAEVASQIRNMGKQRSLSEQTLESAVATLQQAGNHCKDGLQQFSQSGNAARDHAVSLEQQLRKQIQQGNAPAVAALAKRHPDWPQSKSWQQASLQAGKCQQQLSAAAANPHGIPAKSTVSPEVAAEEPSPADPTPPPATPPPPAPADVASAPAADINEPPAAGIQLRDKQAENDDWTELAEDPEPSEPETAADNALKEKKQIRKSWTDLVQ